MLTLSSLLQLPDGTVFENHLKLTDTPWISDGFGVFPGFGMFPGFGVFPVFSVSSNFNSRSEDSSSVPFWTAKKIITTMIVMAPTMVPRPQRTCFLDIFFAFFFTQSESWLKWSW